MKKEDYMRLALSLARRGEGKVSPNPMVGAILIKNGKVVGKGYHRYFGGPHAEVEAIKDAGKKARGSTLFVTLEPCCHFGKTPPCTDAIIKSGIKEVFVARIDPNPLNEGKGIQVLKKAGIKVEVGLCEKEAGELNRWFFKFIKENIPYVIVKSAASLDGKIATFKGDSKWITSDKARRWGKNLRFCADAILVGINTVIRDNPQLLPPKKKKRFLRLILDTHLNIPLKARVLENQDLSPTLVFTGKDVEEGKVKFLEKKKVKVIQVEEENGKVSIRKVLEKLGEMQIAILLVEGGGKVISSFVERNFADEIFLFLSPRIIGGKDAPTWVEGKGFESLNATPRVNIKRIRKLGEDILIQGIFEK